MGWKVILSTLCIRNVLSFPGARFSFVVSAFYTDGNLVISEFVESRVEDNLVAYKLWKCWKGVFKKVFILNKLKTVGLDDTVVSY